MAQAQLSRFQLAALSEILDIKKFKYRDIKYNIELRTLPPIQAYLDSRKSVADYRARNLDPNGPEELLPNFSTVYIDKGKLYSLSGYIPKLESKHDSFQEDSKRHIPKCQHKTSKFFNYMKEEQVPYVENIIPTNNQRLNSHQHFISAHVSTMADELNKANGGNLWKLIGAYIYVIAAAWDVVLRNLLKTIDAQVNWNAASNETVKQATRVYKMNLQLNISKMVDDDEVAFATNIGKIYNNVDPITYRENQSIQLQLGYQAPESQMETN
ncbi:MAG: hypothetical protein EZS28_005324 [Streblomastix strix]|uniref:Uncharacterized protein n=1 Tax=Streblomastix strix TaxID=222440 RepID=A0A5J4WY34_9EUKA|nr:MAG: hypothetical protein EZS28_005324 [Streblomastix strix]